MKPSIALLSGNVPPVVCGIGDYSTRLAEELRKIGYPVRLYSREQGVVPETDTVRTPAPRLDKAGITVFLARLTEDRPGVLHLQYEVDSYDNNGLALFRLAVGARRIGASLVTTFHALDGPRLWGRFHRLALIAGLIGSRDIVVCSKRQHDALAKLPGVGAKTHLIPVGSTVPVTGKRSIRAPGEPLHLVYFGFVWRGRNLETCVRALAAVNEQTAAVLTIAGAIKDDSYRREVESLTESLGVRDKVTFTGDIPAAALSQILTDADIALLPFASGVSTGRSTFVATLEHGLPAVTMATPGNRIPEFVNGENMLYVSPADTDGFIRETLRLATDTALRRSIADNTATLARHFSWQEIAQKTANLPSYRG
ncbi:MAG: glycosyltransferase family 4 protein [Akkermansiaceae bacterium]|nr:glycosyltransferase family 4 protein [Armatimonadota bacterium]